MYFFNDFGQSIGPGRIYIVVKVFLLVRNKDAKASYIFDTYGKVFDDFLLQYIVFQFSDLVGKNHIINRLNGRLVGRYFIWQAGRRTNGRAQEADRAIYFVIFDIVRLV